MWSEFLQTTSCHGMLHVHKSKSKGSKAFWIAIIIVVSGGLGYILFETIQRFIHKPTVTSVEIVQQKFMKMPEILICQDRSLRLKFLAKNNISEQLAMYIQLSLLIPEGAPDTSYTEEEEMELEKQYHLLMHRFPQQDVRELFLAAGPNCESMFTKCAHNYEPMNCCKATSVKIDPIWGKCFLFKNLTNQIWPVYGVVFEVTFNPKEYVASYGSSTGLGISIRIQPQYDQFYGSDVKIPVGHLANIELEREVIYYENTILQTVCDPACDAYGPKNCVGACYLKRGLELCHCSAELYDQSARSDIFEICSPAQAKKCLQAELMAEVCLPYINILFL